MILHIKNMVSNSCKLIVKSELEKLGWHYIKVALGEVEIKECLSPEEQNLLNVELKKWGFVLMDDKKNILIEKIKISIIEMVYYSEEKLKVNLSDFLSEKLDYNYNYLAGVFSESQGINIEQFYLTCKIERIKELLTYDEYTISEIADKLHYSNVAHLSNQFKKMTGLTPSQYKNLRHKRRKPLENV